MKQVLLLFLLTSSLFALEKNKRGFDYFGVYPTALLGTEITFINDDIPTDIRAGIGIESALFITPKLGFSVLTGLYYNQMFGSDWYQGSRISRFTRPGFDFQWGVGLRTERISSKTGNILPYNMHAEAAICYYKPDSRYGYVQEFHLKFDFEWGVQRELNEVMDCNILFYISGHLLEDGIPIAQPGCGIKFQPIIKKRIR